MKTENMRLRKVTMADADMLLAWRNDRDTREASLNTEEVSLASHLAWLESSLNKLEQRRLWVAQLDDVAVGTCRADLVELSNEIFWELSWTVAPDARGKGVSHQMLSLLMEEYPKPLLAQVKEDNAASIKVAERAGFKLVERLGEHAKNGVLLYCYSLIRD